MTAQVRPGLLLLLGMTLLAGVAWGQSGPDGAPSRLAETRSMPQVSREAEECLDRVTAAHGALDPAAVVGYRLGVAALRTLDRPRFSRSMRVTLECPSGGRAVAIADGLMAAMGVTPGRRSLHVVESEVNSPVITLEDLGSRQTWRTTLTDELAQSLRQRELHGDVALSYARMPERSLFFAFQEVKPQPAHEHDAEHAQATQKTGGAEHTPATAGGHAREAHSPSEMNAQFRNPDLDVQAFVRRFESESRDVFQKRDLIVESLAVRPGMAVADIGAGTGLFTRLIARKLGEGGRVYAVEIAPAFLKHIGTEAEKAGLQEVIVPVESSAESTNLKPGSIDLAFVCATYHHFEKPASILASIHSALRPGGRLVVIDFDLRPDASAFVKAHARAPLATYVDELKAAGFERVAPASGMSITLKDNFVAEFRKLPSEAEAGGNASP
jgi:ubiquinone/menaquinone biosynthesis C-methylase UbiE/formylmethanofuran dehydrogenase subunit E